MRCTNAPYNTTNNVDTVSKRVTVATPMRWAEVVNKKPVRAHDPTAATDVSRKRGGQASKIVLRSLSKNNSVKLNSA
jgi:hypothetical protein